MVRTGATGKARLHGCDLARPDSTSPSADRPPVPRRPPSLRSGSRLAAAPGPPSGSLPEDGCHLVNGTLDTGPRPWRDARSIILIAVADRTDARAHGKTPNEPERPSRACSWAARSLRPTASGLAQTNPSGSAPPATRRSEPERHPRLGKLHEQTPRRHERTRAAPPVGADRGDHRGDGRGDRGRGPASPPARDRLLETRCGPTAPTRSRRGSRGRARHGSAPPTRCPGLQTILAKRGNRSVDGSLWTRRQGATR
jgi:hypothetical protein